MSLTQPANRELREVVATELIAHGEFSSIGNSYPNALLAADAVLALIGHATLQARVEELTKALREISDLYVNAPGWAAPEPSHAREYKMHQIARSALSLERSGGAT